MPRIHPQADDRLEGRGGLDFRAPRRRTGTAPRAAGDLPADDGNPDPLEEHRLHGRRPDSLPARRDGHRAPRRHHRPALDELAHLAQRAQGPRARDHRAARGADHLRPVPPDARFLAPRRRDDGAVDDEKRRPADRDPHPHVRALRSQELAPGRLRGVAAGDPAVRDPHGALPPVSRGHGLDLARLEEEHDPARPALRLRRDDPDHAGRRLDLRGPRDLPTASRGGRGAAARPLPPPPPPRHRRDGRGLPRRAPAPEASLRPETDPDRPPRRSASARAIRARGHASPPPSRTPTRSRSSTTAGPRTALTTTSWNTCPA